MKKVLLKSIGCRTNQVEMAGLGSELEARGYALVRNYADAEIIIINTCSVTGNTESKIKRLIRSCSKNYPKTKILVTGCLAQQVPDELMAIEGVQWVVGNTKKMDIPEILATKKEGLSLTPVSGSTGPVSTFGVPVLKAGDSSRTRFHVKIQEGCDFLCSYCIVPILRGPSRSVAKSEVITLCKAAVQAGYKELVVTGTHIGQYTDNSRYRLEELVDDIIAIDGDFRLRLSSLDPRDCSEGLLQRIESEARICKHLHLSIQSLSRDVMVGMNRFFNGYDQFKEQLIAFRSRNPYVGLGGDFIVGFPGETQPMFEETLAMVKKAGFNYGHVFRYSKRPGTTAASMDNQVNGGEMIKRSAALRERLLSVQKLFVTSQVGSVKQRIIVENEKPVRGITSNYIRVRAPEVQARHNTWCDVTLQKYDPENNWCIAMSDDRG